jgi:hypothetical protein
LPTCCIVLGAYLGGRSMSLGGVHPARRIHRTAHGCGRRPQTESTDGANAMRVIGTIRATETRRIEVDADSYDEGLAPERMTGIEPALSAWEAEDIQ